MRTQVEVKIENGEKNILSLPGGEGRRGQEWYREENVGEKDW